MANLRDHLFDMHAFVCRGTFQNLPTFENRKNSKGYSLAYLKSRKI
ncbi:hypothetical protein T02_677 [Trichinella nativa]|uniref:Uncharacterized protein n=1 Tax=Trichinella nativa TaxID=6335 RepID=A0A0V1KGU6_9BILA|nr:hypothetical protein T02_677 [Trichinella nativa]